MRSPVISRPSSATGGSCSLPTAWRRRRSRRNAVGAPCCLASSPAAIRATRRRAWRSPSSSRATTPRRGSRRHSLSAPRPPACSVEASATQGRPGARSRSRAPCSTSGSGSSTASATKMPQPARPCSQLVQGQDLAAASEAPRERGWLRAEATSGARRGSGGGIHGRRSSRPSSRPCTTRYPDDAWLTLRRGVGTQLCAALAAERQSVVRSPDETTREQLIECSRLTSVLPFQIIETLAGGAGTAQEPSAGTRLGEAMWRIDDLVDLCDDTRTGALNAVLLAATPDAGRRGERDLLTALERLLASTDIACAAAEAAEWLLAGLRLGGSPDDHPLFLHFVQRYAGHHAAPEVHDSAASMTSSNSVSSTGRSVERRDVERARPAAPARAPPRGRGAVDAARPSASAGTSWWSRSRLRARPGRNAAGSPASGSNCSTVYGCGR